MAETEHALIRAALAPVRAQPDVRAEQVSQELLGAVLQVIERSGEWARVTGEDGYEGWVQEGGLIFCPAEKAEAWWDDAGGRPAVALDATLADQAGRVIARLPWGARVAVVDGLVRLPDGREGRLLEGRLVDWSERAHGFPADALAVVATGWEWLGVPYLWGGRTRWGTDCSGFVQAVYRLHGFLLPRDSYQQAEIGGPVEAGPGLEACNPGDLLFFHGRDSDRVVHVALSLGGAEILHAAEPNGQVAPDDLAAGSDLQRSLADRVSGVRRLFA
ncbi:MAG: SH3 domain-containing protein [Gemmatimonadetes bacterium]|nr:SH3 domain-containing protein [Gemmatimonadota bacterium]NIO33101.1 SH3 domain-containing protein [Gemmatimonadota bacterium]